MSPIINPIAWQPGALGKKWRGALTHITRLVVGLDINNFWSCIQFCFSGFDRWSWLSVHYPQVLPYIHLIDAKNSHFRAQTESVTFLGNHSENTKYIYIWHLPYYFFIPVSSRNLYAIPGLDYVAHEDILPYKTNETNPLQVIIPSKLSEKGNHLSQHRRHPLCITCIDHLSLLPQHELFDKFLMFSEGREPPFQAQDTLRAWQEKVKAFAFFWTSWPHPPELDTVLFRTTPGLSWATYTRRPLRISGSQWSHSTWASGRGMWPFSLLWRQMLPILMFPGRTSRTMYFGGDIALGT